MTERDPFQGVASVARFNWPYYVAAALVLGTGALAACLAPPLWAKGVALAAVTGALWFLAGSLGVSHWVYDRSDLYRWKWLRRALGGVEPRSAVICHTGFDEVSAALKEKFPATRWQVLDHFDPATMTEPSIRRARKLHPPAQGTLAAPFGDWPDLEAEAVFGLLAIHELRPVNERAAWFAQARRSLTPGGRVIVAEGVRDAANFIAFGPGFLHFHSVASWRASWEMAGLRLTDSFRVTPFVRIFVLEAPREK